MTRTAAENDQLLDMVKAARDETAIAKAELVLAEARAARLTTQLESARAGNDEMLRKLDDRNGRRESLKESWTSALDALSKSEAEVRSCRRFQRSGRGVLPEEGTIALGRQPRRGVIDHACGGQHQARQ